MAHLPPSLSPCYYIRRLDQTFNAAWISLASKAVAIPPSWEEMFDDDWRPNWLDDWVGSGEQAGAA